MAKPSADQRSGPLVKERRKLDEIHNNFTYAVDRWKSIREQRTIDMRHVAGDPWEPKEKLARTRAMRPCPATDEISQYLNQVINGVKGNPRAARFSPVGFGANDKTANFYGDKWREIEYRSKAQIAYTRAFQNTIEGSYGYVKLFTEFATDMPGGPAESHSAFNRRICVGSIPDPDVIYPDPDFLDPTGRDWNWLFDIETQSVKEFKKANPNAEITNFSPDLIKYSKGWITGSGRNMTIRVASYWEVEKKTKILNAWEVQNPETGGVEELELFDDEVELTERAKKFGANLIEKREVEDRTVWQYRTNGVEILKKIKWPGRWIPYVSFFGKMLYLDGPSGPELVIQSMTRPARQANMLLAYYLACEAEQIGMTPKVPWFVWKGSIDRKNATKLQKANFEPVPFIEIDPLLTGGTGGQTPGFPERVPLEAQIQAIEIAKESCRRMIQAAMAGTPLPTSMQKDNPKLSGRAIDKYMDSGERGSYHYVDSYDMGLVRVAELGEDLIPKIYDAAGETPTLDGQKRPQSVFINTKMLDEAAVGQIPKELAKTALESVDGLHAVTIDVAPAETSQRQASSDFVDVLIGSPFYQMLMQGNAQMALEIMALCIKLKNLGPVGEEIADILDPNEEEQTVPAAKLQEVVQMGEQMRQMLQSRIQELEQELDAKIVDNEGKAAIAAENNRSKEAIAKAEIDKDILIQQMKEDIEMRKLRVGDQKADKDREAGVATEGAKLSQKTAMDERKMETQQAEGREAREAAARESDANRQSADRNAAEERKIKAKAAAKPQGVKK